MAGWNNIFFCAQNVEVSDAMIEKLMKYDYRNHLAYIYVYAYDNKPEIVAKAYYSKFQLCAQLRVCSQADGIPVYPRFSQPDNSESWDDAGNGI